MKRLYESILNQDLGKTTADVANKQELIKRRKMLWEEGQKEIRRIMDKNFKIKWEEHHHSGVFGFIESESDDISTERDRAEKLKKKIKKAWEDCCKSINSKYGYDPDPKNFEREDFFICLEKGGNSRWDYTAAHTLFILFAYNHIFYDYVQWGYSSSHNAMYIKLYEKHSDV